LNQIWLSTHRFTEGQDESKLWRAALPIRSGMNAPHLQNLTIPRQAHELECFRNTCQLFSVSFVLSPVYSGLGLNAILQFMDEILSNVYVAAHEKKSPEAINSSVRCIRDRMISWQASQISSNILIDPQNLPTLCPPPHIIHFKYVSSIFPRYVSANVPTSQPSFTLVLDTIVSSLLQHGITSQEPDYWCPTSMQPVCERNLYHLLVLRAEFWQLTASFLIHLRVSR
jgi:hypothetical protein